MGPARIQEFQKTVRMHYRRHGRDLPWRKTTSPYRILVSEVMLQQTQVDRVVLKYREFIKTFPDVRALSEASPRDVLRVWQGLGYNRRAKMLRDAARDIVHRHKGRVPSSYEALTELSGVGDYTTHAVCVFAYNKPEVMVETNIRSAFLHHFFPRRSGVPDSTLTPLIAKSLDRENPREWYAALMDYGAHLKRVHENPSRRSAHYIRQSRFEGSNRQIRGAIIRLLLEKGVLGERALARAAGAEQTRVAVELKGLLKEGLIVRKNRQFKV